MAQRPAGKQLATIASYFVTGTLIDAIRNHVAGRRTIDQTVELWETNP